LETGDSSGRGKLTWLCLFLDMMMHRK
jgi:hypothetical protein